MTSKITFHLETISAAWVMYPSYESLDGNLTRALHSGVAHFTIHDLRRAFSSMMAEIGTPILVTEKLLNHISGSFGGVAGIYNRYTYLPEMRKALEASEAHLKGILAASV